MECDRLPEGIQELSFLLTDDSEIQKLNSSYRGKDKPTDVLSFSQLEGMELAGEQTSLGDVAISLDTAMLQSEKAGISFEEELLRLSIHGILHLFGYDHENVSDKQAEEMEQLEEKLLLSFRTELTSFSLESV